MGIHIPGTNINFDPTPGFNAPNAATLIPHSILGTPQATGGVPVKHVASQPNVGNTLADTTNTPSGGPSAPAAPATDAYGNTVTNYDQSIQSLKDNLASALAGLSGAQKTANNSFNTAVNSSTTTHDRNQAGYDTQQSDTTNSEQKALGQVDTNARTLSDSLRRIIGMAGGANSSAYLYAAPNAVAREATGQRTDTLDTYGTNLRDLNTARTQESQDFQTLLDNLATQKQSQLQGAQQSTDQNLLKTYGSLADTAARRAALLGVDPIAASQPYTSQIDQRQAELDHLLANPILAPTIKPLTAATPNLSAYNVDRGTINANQEAGTNSPYAYFLNPQKKQDQTAQPLTV